MESTSMNDKDFYLCKCKDKDCAGSGIVEYYRPLDPDKEEPFWVPCPRCRRVMDMVRPAHSTEIETLPELTRYGPQGPVFYVRTDFLSGLPVDASSSNVTGGAKQDQEGPSTIFMSSEYSAKLLGVGLRTFLSFVHDGKLVPIQVDGKNFKFTREQLEEFARSETVSAKHSGGTNKAPGRKDSSSHEAQEMEDVSPEALKKELEEMRKNRR